jgi:hypothetical protein
MSHDASNTTASSNADCDSRRVRCSAKSTLITTRPSARTSILAQYSALSR